MVVNLNREDDFLGWDNLYGPKHDIKRIIKIGLSRGILLSPLEADKAWQEHSDTYAAGWLMLPEEDGAVWSDLPAWARGE